VDRNVDRLAEMRLLLQNASSNSNITKTISHVRLMAFALVMPHVDSASVLVPNVSYETRAPSLTSATAHCTVAFTRYLDTPLVKITAQELRLKRAIEGVLKRICKFYTAILGDCLSLLEPPEGDSSDDRQARGRRKLEIWSKDVEALMGWLRWAMWRRCSRQCNWDVSRVFVPSRWLITC